MSGTGRLIIVAGPSGVGKTTVVAELLRARPDLHLSVSATTRTPRDGEADGVQYRFLTSEAFAELEASGGLLEAADVHGNRYGTPRAPVEEALAEGRSIVLEIDIQGADQVKAAKPDALSIFILPPSDEVLFERLTGRGTETDESVRLRLAAARRELDAAGRFDHRVVNDDIERAVAEIIRILESPDPPTQESP